MESSAAVEMTANDLPPWLTRDYVEMALMEREGDKSLKVPGG